MKRGPCRNCPWKRFTPRHGFPGERICLPRLLRAIRGGVFDPAMQCHATPDGDEAQVCVGFAQVVGFTSVPLRRAAHAGRYDPDTIAAPAEPMHTLESMVLFHGATR